LGGLAGLLRRFCLLLALLVSLGDQRLLLLLEGLALRFLLLNIGCIVCIDLYLVEERQTSAFRLMAAECGQG